MKYQEIVKATNEIVDQYEMRLTVRQIYYRLVSPPYQLFENIPQRYKAFDRMLVKAREREDIPWWRIEDRTRKEVGGEEGYTNYEEFFEHMFDFDESMYSRQFWVDQPRSAEVWIEKDALARLVSAVANSYGVLTCTSSGYSSLTKLFEAVDRFEDAEKPVTILHLSDHDPSGLDMGRDLGERLQKYGAENFEIKRVALTHAQVREFSLAPNPTKRADARSRGYVQLFGDECWELDALPPEELQQIVEKAIVSLIDSELWRASLDQLKREREAIKRAIKRTRPKLEEIEAILIKQTEGCLVGHE